MKTTEEYVALAESELAVDGAGYDRERATARAAVWTALAAIAQNHHTREPSIEITAPTVHSCPNHAPTQHRDGKPKWCNTCGRTTSGIHHDDLPRADGVRPEGTRP